MSEPEVNEPGIYRITVSFDGVFGLERPARVRWVVELHAANAQEASQLAHQLVTQTSSGRREIRLLKPDPVPVVDDEPDDPRISRAEDERDDPPDDYGWFEDSPYNPNIPRR